MPPYVAAIAGKAASLLRRPGRTAAILGGGIAALVGVIVLINFVFARPNPLEALYEQGKLAKSSREASNMYEGLFCKQVEAYLDGDAELNALPYIANLLTVADSKGFTVPVEVVRALVELGADVNAKSKIGAFGETPWNLAVKMGDIAMLDYLASAGAKKTEFPEMEQPHVVQAVLDEKEELLRTLVRHGMSLEVQKSASDYTALMAAADKGNTKMLNLLIELGANVNATRAELGGEKVTVLDMVLQDGRDNDAELAGILIKAGAKATPNKLADKLFRCIDEGRTERLKMLLDAGAPLDAVQEFTAYTPLMAAVDENSPEMVKLLLDAGADPKVTTKDDMGIELSALSIAKRKASPAVLALLGDEQAIKMQKSLGDTKLISLDEAVEMLQKCEIIDEFATTEDVFSGKVDDSKGKISKKFLYNYKMFKEGSVPLSDYNYVSSIYFCWRLEPAKHLPKEAIIAFIASGSALSSISGPAGSMYMFGEFYALDYAAGEGHTDIVQMLIAAGADVSEGTPLLKAAEAGHTDIVQMLIAAGADVSKGTLTQGVPLAAAARGGHTEIVKLLLERPEIDTDIRIDSETARKYPEIAELLKAAKRKKLEKNEEVSTPENSDSSLSVDEDVQVAAGQDSDSLTALIDTLSQTEYNNATLKLYQKRLLGILPRIAAGESVNTIIENANGTTALHNACGLGHYDIVKWLLDNGADCSLRTAKGASVETCIGNDPEGNIAELIKQKKKSEGGDETAGMNAAQVRELGVDYAEARNGKNMDEAHAIRLYIRAAEMGDMKAQRWMGWRYRQGRGVPKDETRARYYFSQAAAQGDSAAAQAIGSSVGSSEPAPTVSRGNETAGMNAAQVRELGVDYAEARNGKSKDEAHAIRLYIRAAEMGDIKAQRWMGWRYRQGRGVPKDETRARYYFSQAAAQGDSAAAQALSQ